MPEINRSIELSANQKYVVRVRAKNKLNVSSDWSESIVVPTDQLSFAVDRPFGLQISSAIRSLFLSWDAVSDPFFSHYEIYISQTPFNGVVNAVNKYGDYVGTFASINKVWHPATSSQVDLTPGTVYYVVMRSVLRDGTTGPFSSEVNATTGYVGDADLVVDSISGNKIQVNSLAADKITTGMLTADVALAGRISTATSGARVEIDSTGIRGYDVSGATPNFDYSTSTGNLVLRGDITAAGFFGEGINVNDKNNWSLNTVADLYREMVPNGSFDSGINGWQAVSGCTIENDLSVYRSGTGSLRIDADGTSSAVASTAIGTSAVPVKDDETYSIVFYCRRSSATTRTIVLTVDYYRADGSYLYAGNGQISAIPNQVNWDIYGEGQIHPPPGACYVAIKFTIASALATEQFYIDDVSIRPVIAGWSLGSGSGSINLLDHFTAANLTITASRNTQSFIEYQNKRTSSSYGDLFSEQIYFGAPIPVEHKRAFKLSFRARLNLGTETRCYVNVDFYDSDYNYMYTTRGSAISIAQSWQVFSSTFRTSEIGAAFAKIGLSFFDTSKRLIANDAIYVDDLFVEQVPYFEDGVVLADSITVRQDILWDKTGFVMPVGAIIPWAGSFLEGTGILPAISFPEPPTEGSIIGSIPPGWIPCDGRQLDISVWPRLYRVIGQTYSSSYRTYTYSSTTTKADPGNGFLRLNNATHTSATQMYIDDLDALSVSAETLMNGINTQTYFYIYKATDTGVYRYFLVDSIVNETGYTTVSFSASSVVSSGTLVNNDPVRVQFFSGLSSGYFRVPDLRGRVPVGLDRMSGEVSPADSGRLTAASVLGDSGGAETHTLTIAEMPAHDHPPPGAMDFYWYRDTAGPLIVASGASFAADAASHAVTGSRGGGGAHNNMQPYILLNYLIKA